MYTDPLDYFGSLNAELWRSIRLVTDTGIHAKGWTRQQVLDYMFANSATSETRAVAEAERFMAIPGQALAYKIGHAEDSRDPCGRRGTARRALRCACVSHRGAEGRADAAVDARGKNPGLGRRTDVMDRIARMQRIWDTIGEIPQGRVASYGQVAAVAGIPRGARQVGYALRQLPAHHDLPWYRVIQASGRIAFEQGTPAHREQSRRLLLEDVTVVAGRVDMQTYAGNPTSTNCSGSRRRYGTNDEPVRRKLRSRMLSLLVQPRLARCAVAGPNAGAACSAGRTR